MNQEILEKLLKKKHISLNSYFGCPLSFEKAKNDSKTKKTFFSSILRLLKYKTVQENWIENLQHLSMQETDYSTIKIENMQLLFAAQFFHNQRAH